MAFRFRAGGQNTWKKLTKRERPTLRHVSIDGWGNEGVERVLAAAPNLHSLSIAGAECYMKSTRHACLNTLSIIADRFDGLPEPLLKSEFPELARLHLRFRVEYAGADALAPLLQDRLFPNLSCLGMTFCFFADEFVAAFSQSPLLPRLKVLDLSHSQLTAVGARTLHKCAAASGHLHSLKLDRNLIDANSAARIREALPNASVEDQR